MTGIASSAMGWREDVLLSNTKALTPFIAVVPKLASLLDQPILNHAMHLLSFTQLDTVRLKNWLADLLLCPHLQVMKCTFSNEPNVVSIN
jgi:hypothetical protein